MCDDSHFSKSLAEAPVPEGDRDTRIKRMSEAFNRIRGVTTLLADGAEELKELAPEVGLLKDYLDSGRWMEDFEADERGEICTQVNRSVLSEDGLYNLLDDLDDLVDTFEELQKRLASEPEKEGDTEII